MVPKVIIQSICVNGLIVADLVSNFKIRSEQKSVMIFLIGLPIRMHRISAHRNKFDLIDFTNRKKFILFEELWHFSSCARQEDLRLADVFVPGASLCLHPSL
jgi:hypothetical protein